MNAAGNHLWRLSGAPGQNMAFWSDGTLIYNGGDQGAPADWQVFVDGGYETRNPIGPRPSIFIPPAPGGPEVTFASYAGVHALYQDRTEAWVQDKFGCCAETPVSVDPNQGVGYIRLSYMEMNLYDGGFNNWIQNQDCNGALLVGASALYCVGPNSVSRAAAGSAITWTTVVNDGGLALDDGVLDSSDNVIASSASGNALLLVESGGFERWEVPVASPTAPVVTSTGLAIVGATGGGAATVDAYRLTDGSLAWSAPIDAAAGDLLLGDDGLVYVALPGASEVVALRQDDGGLDTTYLNVPQPAEALLRGGAIYTYGSNGSAVAFPVGATRYDQGSPWPVKLHDNQRTRCVTAPLTY